MARNKWSISLMLCSTILVASCAKISYPDSYELYSYKEPRTMNDFKNQHMRQAMIDVTETINEVQKILQKDPKLPRLTRGEIEDLFEMVTREEYKRSLAIGDYQRAKHMRSLMLVLPFNTNNYSEERLEELFTQMPITKMVNSVSKLPKPQRIVLPASAENVAAATDMTGAHSLVLNQKMPTTFKPNLLPSNMKTTYTAPVTTFHPNPNLNVNAKGQMITTLYPTVQTHSAYPVAAPTQMITNYYPRATMQAISTFHPKTMPMSTYNPKLTVGPVSTFHPKATPQIISTFHPKATDRQAIAANAIPSAYISTYHPKQYKMTPEMAPPMSSQSPFNGITQKYSSRFNGQTTNFITSRSIATTIRPNVKNLLATIGLEPDNNALEINNQMSELQSPNEATSSSTTTTERATISTTTTTTTTTTPAPTVSTTAKPVLTPELKELLASFGLLTNEEPPAHVAPAGSVQDEFHPIFPNSLKDESLSLSEFKPLPKSVTASDIKEKIDSSFEIKPDDFTAFKPLPIKENVQSKDQELENLLKSYGILEDDRASKLVEEANDDLSLDDSQDVGSEIVEVREKVPQISKVPEVDVGFLSPDLAKVLGNIGVKSVSKVAATTPPPPTLSRRIDHAATTIQATRSTAAAAGQLPSSTMENDYQKLHLLLDTIKQLDNLTANLTDEELEKLNLKNFNLSQDILTESTGPNPTDGAEPGPYTAKNEVKRQVSSSEPTRIQLDLNGSTVTSTSSPAIDDLTLDDDLKADDGPTSTTSSTTTTTTKSTTQAPERKGKQEDLNTDEVATDSDDEKETETSSKSTTEESKNGSIGDLAGSFGGNDGLDPVSEEPLPPPRKNGFYFFSDWNSFLEVGEDPDKVIVRFDPKIGDQTPFVQVKIP